MIIAGLSAGVAQAASVQEITGFGSNPGNLQLFEYIPDGLPADAPLVVAMHGANSDYTLMSDITGWKELADRYDFALAMPQQKSANSFVKSFNFHQTGDNTRGNGEALSIKQMVDYELANHDLDSTKVFATGFSAGGHMTSVMLAAYPEVFEAGAPYAGGAYACTASDPSGCGSAPNMTPQQWGDLVRSQNPSYPGPWPRVTVGQGDADQLNNPAWMQEIVDQWTNVQGIDQTADTSDTIKGFPHKVYANGSGASKVETISLTGLGHKMAVDPGSGADQCGATDFIASEDVNLCHAYEAAKFFGITQSSPPGGGTTIVLDDVDAQDGYVKANTNGSSPEVGTLETSTGLGLGKSTAYPYKHMRSLLSFNTAAIPDSATITRAFLTVTRQTSGGDPWGNPSGNSLVLDIKNGCFGSACTIGTDDWAAAAGASAVASIPQFSSGSKNSGDFSAAGIGQINKTGTTQLKLRFSQFQTLLYYVTVYGGGSSNRAKLTVVYQ